ncbi:MAG: nickel transporter, partial [Candidatus Krumholzibacteriia bacterium]
MRPDLSEVGLLLTIVLAGFLAGGIHVLTGPDHLAAVAPLAAAERRRIWRAGLQWGLGHTGGVWGVAALALLTRGLLPVQLLSSWSERFVGVALIGLGLWALRRALASRVHVHEHEHDGVHHRHVHVHRHTSHHDERSHAHAHAALAFGVLHGAAGSSHFLGVLPALALPTHQ